MNFRCGAVEAPEAAGVVEVRAVKTTSLRSGQRIRREIVIATLAGLFGVGTAIPATGASTASTRPVAATTPSTSTTRSVASTTSASSTTTPSDIKGLVLQRPRTIGEGVLLFSPPTSNQRPKSSAANAKFIAKRGLEAGSIKLAPEVFFALFTASSPEQLGPDGKSRPVFLRRPVWVVRYPLLVQSRFQLPEYRSKKKDGPTTTIPKARTQLVVVIDDVSGREVLRSEFATDAESASR